MSMASSAQHEQHEGNPPTETTQGPNMEFYRESAVR